MGRQMEGTMGARRFAIGFGILFMVMPLLGMARRVKIDRTQQADFSVIVGKEFKTVVEFLLYRSADSRQIVIGKYGDSLPKKGEMKDKFPFWFYSAKVLGILPPGSVFKVIRVTEEGNTEFSITRYYAVLVTSENKMFVGKEIDPTSLTESPTEFVRVFDPKFVEEVTPQ